MSEAKEQTKTFKALGKIKKGTWKAMKGSFEGIKGAAGSLSPFMQLMGVMKFFQPILKPINALLKVLMASVFKPLMPIFQTIGKLIMGMMPLIKELGETVGTLIAGVLQRIMPIITKLITEVAPPLIRILIIGVNLLFKLMPLLDALMPIIMILVDALVLVVSWLEMFVKWIVGGSPGLIPAIEAVVEIIQILVEGALNMLMATFEFLGEVMEHVGEVIEMIISGALNILIVTFEFLGKVMTNISKILKIVTEAFAFLGNLIKDIILGVIDGFVRGMEAFARVLEAVVDLIRTVTFQGGKSFQFGTPFVPETGLATVHKGERIISAPENRALMRGGGVAGLGGTGEGRTIVIHMHFEGAIITDEYGLDELAQMISERIFMEID